MDIYRDNGEHLATYKDLPDFVKEAAFLEPEELAGLSDGEFAYVNGHERAFPLVDKGHVATSVIYFIGRNGGDMPAEQLQKTAAALCNACVKFDLTPPEKLVKLAQFGMLKQAEVARVQPSKKNLERAVSFFMEKTAEYDPPTRRVMCTDFVKEAINLGVDELPDEVLQYASNSWNPGLSEELEVRKHMFKKAGLTEAVEVIEELEKAAFVVDPEEFAATLYDLDKEAGLLQLYDTRLTDAYKATFGVPMEPDTTIIEDDLRKFAQSSTAAASLNPQLLVKLAADPLGTIDTLDSNDVELVQAVYEAYRASE